MFNIGQKVTFSESRIRRAKNRPLGSSGRRLPSDEFILTHEKSVFQIHRINPTSHVQLTRDGQIYHHNWNLYSISVYKKPVNLPEELFIL